MTCIFIRTSGNFRKVTKRRTCSYLPSVLFMMSAASTAKFMKSIMNLPLMYLHPI